MIAARTGAALLAVCAVAAAGAEVPKVTPAPTVALKPAPIPRVALATKRRPTLSFESSHMTGRVGNYLEFQITCWVDGNGDSAVKKCPIDLALDGTKFGSCSVTAIIDISPGASRCGFVLGPWPHGRHVLTARVPPGPLLDASPVASSMLDVERSPTRLTYTYVLFGSGATVRFFLENAKRVGGGDSWVPLAGRTISVKANGVPKGTVQTDATGHANFNLSAGGTLSQDMQPLFEGDVTYEPTTAAPHHFTFSL